MRGEIEMHVAVDQAGQYESAVRVYFWSAISDDLIAGDLDDHAAPHDQRSEGHRFQLVADQRGSIAHYEVVVRVTGPHQAKLAVW